MNTELDRGLDKPFTTGMASGLGADDLTPLCGDSKRLKGNGGRIGPPVGIRKKTLLHGDGCSKWEHCETCPFPECCYQECHESMVRKKRETQ